MTGGYRNSVLETKRRQLKAGSMRNSSSFQYTDPAEDLKLQESQMDNNAPSRTHTNRKSHNWLVYDILDRFMVKFTDCYNGDLYDLGCGNRPYEEFFLSHADNYIGVDWSNTHHSLTADIVADLNCTLPIDSNCADTVVSLSVMEHLSSPDVFLSESFRILRPAGKIVLQVPFQWHIHEAPYDFFRYTPYGLRHLFANAGFDSIEIHASSGFFTTMILKANYFSRRFVRGPRLIKIGTQTVLSVFWYLGQVAAPLLDRLDKDWEIETQGFWVTATKPTA